MKMLRVLVSIVLLAVFVCVIAIGALLYFIDPNKLKPVIADEVMKRTGYQLAIDGKLSWSLYPTIGVKLQHIVVMAPGQPNPFLDMRDISIAMQLKQILRGVDTMEGDIYIGSVNLSNLKAQSAHVGLHWQDNKLTLSPITASLYNGSLHGIAGGRDLATVPVWQWKVAFDNIQIQPLLADINGADSKLTIAGTGKVTFDAATWGTTKARIINNLNGTLDYSIVNGSVSGIDLNYLMQTADALLNKKSIAAPTNANQTTFDSLTSTVTIKNGLAETNNLLLKAPGFTTSGNGSINLPFQAINFQLQINPAKEAKTQWQIPVLIAGNLNHPDVRLDMAEVDKMLASQAVDKVKDKVREQIQKKVPGEAGQVLQKLLGS